MTVRLPEQAAPPRSAEVFADLRLESDGHRAHLIGDGRSLVLHVDEPLRMASSLRRTSLPDAAGAATGARGLGRLATALDGVGVTVDVRGRDGVLLVRLGHGAGTRIGRLLTRSDAVRFGSARDLTGAVGDALPTSRILLATVVSIGITAVVVTARRARAR